MKLDQLHQQSNAFSSKRRVGRGEGSRKGGTSARGHKGAQSRSGYSRKIHFEGGQMPLQMRLPKFGFKNPFRKEYEVIGFDELERVASELSKKELTKEDLKLGRVIRSKDSLVKVLANGTLESNIIVHVDAASSEVVKIITEKGGKVVIEGAVMKSLITTLRNIFKIDELRAKILFTLSMILAYRFGSFITLPGIDSSILQEQFAASQGEGILGFIDTFVGGAFARGSILALGIIAIHFCQYHYSIDAGSSSLAPEATERGRDRATKN